MKTSFEKIDPEEFEIAQKKLFNNLKLENPHGPMVENNPEGYSIRLVGREGDLFYQENEKAIIVEITSKHHKNIFSLLIGSILDQNGYCAILSSVVRWDTGELLSQEDRERVKNRIVAYFRKYQKGSVNIV